MKSKCRNGFTLAELLSVVAILSVLTAICIPVFASKLESSREAVDLTVLRAAYSIAVLDAMTGAYKQLDRDGVLVAATENGYLLASESGENAIYYAFYDTKLGKLSAIPTENNGKGTGVNGGIESTEGPICYWGTTEANRGYPAVVIQDEGGVVKCIQAGFLSGELEDCVSEVSFMR